MKFSLENFRNKPVTRKPSENSEISKKLKYEIEIHFNKKLNSIKNRDKLRKNERLLVARQIASACHVSPSTLTLRRQPQLIALIQELNIELELAWISQSKSQHSSGEKKTKEQLILENKLLVAEISRLSNLKLADALTAAIESMLTEECRLQAHTIRQLKLEIQRMQKVIDNQATLNQQSIQRLS
jgi:hypothetical protein